MAQVSEQQAGVGAAPGRRSIRSRAGRLGRYGFLAPALLIVCATVLFPLGYSVDQSLHHVGIAEIVSGQAPWAGLENYAREFGEPAMWRAFVVSLIYTTGTVVLAFSIAMLLAVFFNRAFPGRNLMRSLLLLAWILPTVVTATIWLWILHGSNGVLNHFLQTLGMIEGEMFWLGGRVSALAAVIAVTAWGFAPFGMLLLLAGLQAISADVYEAARIDGANAFQRFWLITVPILRPVNLTVSLLLFILTFKAFDSVYLMTRGGPGGATMTLPIYGYQEAYTFHRYGEGAAATMILLVVPLVLSFFYFRSLRREEQS